MVDYLSANELLFVIVILFVLTGLLANAVGFVLSDTKIMKKLMCIFKKGGKK